MELLFEVEQFAGMQESERGGAGRVGTLGKHPVMNSLSVFIVMRGGVEAKVTEVIRDYDWATCAPTRRYARLFQTWKFSSKSCGSWMTTNPAGWSVNS